MGQSSTFWKRIWRVPERHTLRTLRVTAARISNRTHVPWPLQEDLVFGKQVLAWVTAHQRTASGMRHPPFGLCGNVLPEKEERPTQ